MADRPEISFVLPVFDKAAVLPHVIRALAAQALPAAAEYVFVDDASRDGSAAVLREAGPRLPGFRLIENAANAGPAARVNQGVEAARGRWLCLLDADEIIAPDAVAALYGLAAEERADLVHGKVARIGRPAAEIVPEPVGARPPCVVSDSPLAAVLAGRGLVRMAWLVDALLFARAGGCDPRVFIQDESLPLRLAAAARRFVDVQAPVTWASAAGGHLSADRAQQHHDRFMAHYNLLRDRPDLPRPARRALARRCLSAAWKAARGGHLPAGRAGLLARYLADRWGLAAPGDATLDRLAESFAALPGIRRPPEAGGGP